MRVTTWLLMEQMPESIAELTESFLIGAWTEYDYYDDNDHLQIRHAKNWEDVAAGEHMELVSRALKIKSKERHFNAMLYGFCSTGNIELIRATIKAGATDFNRGLISALSYQQLEAIRVMKLMIKTSAAICPCGILMAEHVTPCSRKQKYETPGKEMREARPAKVTRF